MDDISKKKLDDIEKRIKKVEDTFSKATKQCDLNKLYERKFELEAKIGIPDKDPVSLANNKLQLSQIESSIELLESEEINLVDEYDINVDEAAAREYINSMPEFDEWEYLIEQNDILDQLEKDLGISKEKK